MSCTGNRVLRRVFLEGEAGLAERMEWPWYLVQPCGFLWQLGGFDCTLWGARALRPMGVGIGIDTGDLTLG